MNSTLFYISITNIYKALIIKWVIMKNMILNFYLMHRIQDIKERFACSYFINIMISIYMHNNNIHFTRNINIAKEIKS